MAPREIGLIFGRSIKNGQSQTAFCQAFMRGWIVRAKVIAMVTVNEDQTRALAKYLELTEPVLERVGAKIVERYKIEKEFVRDKPAETIIVVDYPSRAAIDEVFSSSEYKEAAPFRDAAFSTYSIHIVE